jgi:hypothetical protein
MSVKTSGLTIAEILRLHINKLSWLTSYEHSVINQLIACRTQILGGHMLVCDECGHTEISYNSCRNRNCPTCQGAQKLKWLASRQLELLPVGYFHLVFTIPKTLHPIFLHNKRLCYNLLFSASRYALHRACSHIYEAGIETGCISVLHTWDQKLLFHPHIHCIVPGGGLDSQRTKWIPSKPHFLVPVRILSELFRARLLRLLERSFKQNLLLFNGEIKKYADKNSFKQLLASSAQTSWVVYAKEPFGGPAQVFNYLGHYTHRVGISNNRLLSMTDTQVTFLWKDRRNKNRTRKMTLDALQFISRFVLHILPKGFVKIRYYGFLGNKVKKLLIPLCTNLIQDCVGDKHGEPLKEVPLLNTVSYESLMETIYRCPVCKKGLLLVVETLPAYDKRPAVFTMEKTGYG